MLTGIGKGLAHVCPVIPGLWDAAAAGALSKPSPAREQLCTPRQNPLHQALGFFAVPR